MIAFDKFKEAYSENGYTLIYSLEVMANEIYGRFAKYLSDDEWNIVFDFYIKFPEWVDKTTHYDGEIYYYIGGNKVYKEKIEKLLYQGVRKRQKYIFEVCSTLDEFLYKIKEVDNL